MHGLKTTQPQYHLPCSTLCTSEDTVQGYLMPLDTAAASLELTLLVLVNQPLSKLSHLHQISTAATNAA